MRGTIVVVAQLITTLSSLLYELFTTMPCLCEESWTTVCHRYGGLWLEVPLCLWYTALSSHANTATISTSTLKACGLFSTASEPQLQFFFWGGDTYYMQKEKSCQRCQDERSAAEHRPSSSSAICSLIYIIGGRERAWTGTFCSNQCPCCPFQQVTLFALFLKMCKLDTWACGWWSFVPTLYLSSIWKWWEYCYKIILGGKKV